MLPKAIIEATAADGGVSIDLLGNRPTEGYMVGIRSELSLIVPLPIWNQIGRNILTDWLASRAELLGRPDYYVGTWTSDSQVYLDISRNIADRAEALALAEAEAQIAIWDLEAGAEITC